MTDQIMDVGQPFSGFRSQRELSVGSPEDLATWLTKGIHDWLASTDAADRVRAFSPLVLRQDHPESGARYLAEELFVFIATREQRLAFEHKIAKKIEESSNIDETIFLLNLSGHLFSQTNALLWFASLDTRTHIGQAVRHCVTQYQSNKGSRKLSVALAFVLSTCVPKLEARELLQKAHDAKLLLPAETIWAAASLYQNEPSEFMTALRAVCPDIFEEGANPTLIRSLAHEAVDKVGLIPTVRFAWRQAANADTRILQVTIGENRLQVLRLDRSKNNIKVRDLVTKEAFDFSLT